MQEIKDIREQWYDESVWDHLAIPKPLRVWDSFLVAQQFDACRRIWSYGRHIYSDRVVKCSEWGDDVVHSVNTRDKRGKPVTLPDPGFYL